MNTFNGLLGPPRHKVFVSFHSADHNYKKAFEYQFARVSDIMISRSVQDGDIPDGTPADAVRRRIRDNYLQDSTVTVVLVGAYTWQRKHVDWEIGASLRNTLYNNRSGLLGVILPTYPRGLISSYNPRTLPPRLALNVACGYAPLIDWTEDPHAMGFAIHLAFERRFSVEPDHSYPNFINNRSGSGWT